jgi:hypothetical protein
MIRVFFSIVLLFSLFALSIRAEEEAALKHFKNLRVVDLSGTIDSIAPDTLHLNFQNLNHIDQFSIANAYRGNLGSPIQPRVFFDRPQSNEFIFADVYYPYLSTIHSARFYDTKTPFSSLYYISGGTRFYEDEQIRFLFTVNPNKKLNIGTTLDYLFARGEYSSLSTKRFAGSLFGTYDSKRYKALLHLSTNNHSNFENGGIQNESYINGSITYPPQNIPVNIRGFSNLKQNQLFLNHQYNIGIERPLKLPNDSIITEYVPVTIFNHTLQIDDFRKRYYEPAVEKTFYENTYGSNTFTNDSSAMLQITNRVGISLAEEFNKWLNFGLTAYAENETYRYFFEENGAFVHQWKSNSSLGAVLAKQRGQLFRYNFAGQLTMLGPKAGDFRLTGDLMGFFRLGKQRIELVANGFIRSDEPSHFHNFYESNHFRWNNDFSKVYKTHVGGVFSIPTLRFKADVSVENISNMIFFNSKALPEQYGGNIQVLAARVHQDFKLGSIVLENQIVYQLTSDQTRLPLPMVASYHNLYYADVWFKVLSMQLGVDMRYHTRYHAPVYMPATGQFHVQQTKLIGNYPVVNVYVNAHLKRTRFFAQYYHINQLFMRGDYYSMPLYPLNPATFRMGISWNFYD